MTHTWSIVSIISILARFPTPNLEPQAEDGRYPYAVSLKDDRGWHWCGGSLIAKDTVLTAACVRSLLLYSLISSIYLTSAIVISSAFVIISITIIHAKPLSRRFPRKDCRW